MFRLIKAVSPLALAAVLAGAAALSPTQDLPTGHPPLPDQPRQMPEVNPADVESVDAVIAAYYDTISGGPETERDWDRFRSLFMPSARFITNRQARQRTVPAVLSPEQFIQSNQAYFQQSGYFETEIARKVDRFGSVAHVFSTYASRRSLDEAEPYSRGVNSIQLLNTDDRWWIVTVMWDYERPGVAIPPEYLPTTDGESQP